MVLKQLKAIPLTYKANGAGAKNSYIRKGLDFTNGTNTTAEIDNDGVVKYNLNKDVDLTNGGSLTIGDTVNEQRWLNYHWWSICN